MYGPDYLYIHVTSLQHAQSKRPADPNCCIFKLKIKKLNVRFKTCILCFTNMPCRRTQLHKVQTAKATWQWYYMWLRNSLLHVSFVSCKCYCVVHLNKLFKVMHISLSTMAIIVKQISPLRGC